MRGASPLVYWSLQVPHILLGLLIIFLLVRLLLAGLRADGNVAARLAGTITSPVMAAVGTITPRLIPPAGVMACSIVWLILARIILMMIAMGFGLRLWG